MRPKVPYRTPLVLLFQVAGAGLLLAMAGIHFYLWLDAGYRTITSPPIGLLFLLNTIGGVVLAVALFVAPRRLFPLAALLALLFDAGTLAALMISLTGSGLFGFKESTLAPLVTQTIWVEGAGVVVLLVLTVLAMQGRGRGTVN